MPLFEPRFLTAALLVSVLAVSACDSPEERAENHFQRGVELMSAGETDRALIEFRNVLEQDQNHTRGRLELARVLRSQGDTGGAIAQYLRLVELDPENAAAHTELAELAIQIQDFAAAERHAEQAYALDPENVKNRALKATVDFRRGDREEALAMAEAVLQEDPNSVPAHMVVIAERMAAQNFAEALVHADAALTVDPANEDLNLARLAVVEQLGDNAAVGDQLKRMVELFPDNAGLRRALVTWHLRAGDNAAAEALLRETAERAPDDPEGFLTVAQFLLETQGQDAARTELERLIETRPEPRPYLQALAQLDFAAGRREEAIASLRSLVEGQETTPDIRELQATLAQLLLETGEEAEAEALTESILAADPLHVAALKMRARMHVNADRTERALADLRTALNEAPRDAEIMTLMAMAHEREGARDLAGERLARAVEASDFGVDESLRYARFLMGDDRLGPAESTVLDALNRAPNNRDLLVTLGQIHLQRRDWARARQVAGILRESGDPVAAEAAASLEIASFQGEGRVEETVAMLERLSTEGEGDLRAQVGLVQAHVVAGNIDAAQAEVTKILEADPESLTGKMLQAGLDVVNSDFAGAEALYREVIAARPELREPYQALFTLLNGTDRRAEAVAVLDEGIAATSRNPNLVNVKAGVLVADGAFEEAITLYEELYALDTSNLVIANNLASLLSTHRDDAESLERAFQVARRLRGTEVSFFQDTYGWILTKRGDAEQALTYLEPAAAALAEDPLVQYHLGMTLFDLERWDEAKAALERAVEIAGPDSGLPQIAAARERIAEIAARPAEPAEEPSDG
jgi:cellulose synthase operon protein C